MAVEKDKNQKNLWEKFLDLIGARDSSSASGDARGDTRGDARGGERNGMRDQNSQAEEHLGTGITRKPAYLETRAAQAQPLTFFNTLTKRKEVFKPLKAGRAGVYDCGPTVYDYAHIGNLRSYVFADILRRALDWNGYAVRQVINITDVGHLTSDADEGEDKMTTALRREGKPLTLRAMAELADFYEKKFKEDLQALNIDVSKILFPRASETIDQQIALIQELERRGFIYKTSDGMYFNVAKFPNYGKLGHALAQNKIAQNSVGGRSRISGNAEKKDPRDFAVWKFNPELGWHSPWGKGFPGWHIECSAMAMASLGTTIDIHTGGIEHIAIHHNNEIAQSEAATDRPFVRYWMHNEWLRKESKGGKRTSSGTHSGAKMSKSAGTFLSLNDIVAKDVSPLAYRYWLLGASYRTPIDFSWDALNAAAEAYARLIEHYAKLRKEAIISKAIQKTRTGEVANGILQPAYLSRFNAGINDDLNTPVAIAVLWELLGDPKASASDKIATIDEFDRALGLDIANQARLFAAHHAKEQRRIPPDVRSLAERREQARRARDWKLADELRAKIEKKGYLVKDVKENPEGFELKALS